MDYKKHFVESWCEKIFMMFPHARADAQYFEKARASFGDNWPEWCGLPMAATYAIITQGADTSIAPRRLEEQGVISLSNLTAALLWVKSKAVFRFDPILFYELTESTSIEKIPIDVLYRLPFYCVFAEAPVMVGSVETKGFFAWMEYDVNNKTPELRLLFLFNDSMTISIPIILSGGDIDDSYDALFESAIKRRDAHPDLFLISGPLDEARSVTKEDILAALNIVLYLCSENMKNEYGSIAARAKDSYGNVKRHTAWDVGVRFGNALRRRGSGARDTNQDDVTNTRERFSPRPHIRRAHWHHFWTGPRSGERKLELRWIHPIQVNMDADIPTVIHQKKKRDDSKQ